jgi:hypothetical protein
MRFCRGKLTNSGAAGGIFAIHKSNLLSEFWFNTLSTSPGRVLLKILSRIKQLQTDRLVDAHLGMAGVPRITIIVVASCRVVKA